MARDLVENQGRGTSEDTNSSREIIPHRDMRWQAGAITAVADAYCSRGLRDAMADVFCLRCACLHDLGDWVVSDFD